ncbi:MAG: GIY-YIG nuclease family protein [Alphaproteobacteria bacterium]
MAGHGTWYVYFMLVGNGHVHTGSTGNRRRRIQTHNSRCVISTRAHPPTKLASYARVSKRGRALRLEC